jgi:hypothetical protein
VSATPEGGGARPWTRRATPEDSLSSRETSSDIAAPPLQAGSSRLSLLLAAAMFVLVVDTSLMNVSIAAVVKDLDDRRVPDIEPSTSIEAAALA